MRVVIENFNMTACEVERQWALQDKYIDLLESQLRQSEEKVQMFRFKVILNSVNNGDEIGFNFFIFLSRVGDW